MEYQQVVREVNSILNEYTIRLTIRQIYYRLVSKLLIPNTRSSYGGLDKILVRARERGHIDWRRIEDRSRQVLGTGDWGFSNIKEFMDYLERRFKQSGDYYTKPLWENQDKTVLVALEKDALSRLFTEVTDPYRVKVFPTRGYGSFTYVKNMAEGIEGDKETIVLYFGDFDPSGRDIERDLTDRLNDYGAENITVERIALTETQIKELNLPPRPEDSETLLKLERDPRTKVYGMEYAVELDAIEPTMLQDIIKKAVSQHIDRDLWDETLEEINREKAEVLKKLETAKIVFEE